MIQEISPVNPTLQKSEGEQHGKIDPILRIHQGRYPGISQLAMILVTILNYYLIFAMLFMQLRGKVLHQQPSGIRLNKTQVRHEYISKLCAKTTDTLYISA